MQNSSFWTHDDHQAGNCSGFHVGTEKPALLLRLQNENDMLKKQVDVAAKMLEKNAESKSSNTHISLAEHEQLKRQISALKEQLNLMADRPPANPDQQSLDRARERLQADQQSLDKAKASLVEQKAALEAIRASLVEQTAAIRKERAEIEKWHSHLATEFARLREQEAGLARSLSLEERQQAITNGDMTSITQSLVADIARLEADITLARERMLAADKLHPDSRREERGQWHTIYATATKELRAARQQLIQLPRPASADARNWKDNLVTTIALAMEQGNVPARTITDFVSRSAGMLAHQDVRKVIANKARKELSVPH